MKLAVCVPSGPADCYGHHTRYAEKLHDIGHDRSVAVEVLHYAAPDFIPRLFANLADEDCLVHFNAFLYDLRLQTRVITSEVRHALDDSRARTLATISDHPFTGFMQEMVKNAHPSTDFFVVDNSFRDEMCLINPALSTSKYIHLPYLAPVSYDESYAQNFDERDFDLVVPLFLTDVSRADLVRFLGNGIDPWFVRAVMATYEAARMDVSRNPFHILDACMRSEGGPSVVDLAQSQPEAVPAILNTLATIDGVARQERRAAAISSLLRSVGKLKVVVLGPRLPSLTVDDNVAFIGSRPTGETAALIGNSRAILNCSPSYPENVHERITVAMLYGSCPITDVNPALGKVLETGEFISYAPESTLTIADIYDIYDVKGIAARAARKAEARNAVSWSGHFDAVMEMARA